MPIEAVVVVCAIAFVVWMVVHLGGRFLRRAICGRRLRLAAVLQKPIKPDHCASELSLIKRWWSRSHHSANRRIALWKSVWAINAQCPTNQIRKCFLEALGWSLVQRRLARYIRKKLGATTTEEIEAAMNILQRWTSYANFPLIVPKIALSKVAIAAIENQNGSPRLVLSMEWPLFLVGSSKRTRWLLADACCHELVHVCQELQSELLTRDYESRVPYFERLRAEFAANWFGSPYCLFVCALAPALTVYVLSFIFP